MRFILIIYSIEKLFDPKQVPFEGEQENRNSTKWDEFYASRKMYRLIS